MARYEREKEFMATLRAVGCAIGDYVGDGNGEVDATVSTPVVDGPMDADPGEEYQYSEEDEDEDGSKCDRDDSRPLLILFDCEMTGLSIYADHITDIGAKVLNPPVLVSSPTFSCLVRTGRTISAIGKMKFSMSSLQLI